jgi:hypothetical protein
VRALELGDGRDRSGRITAVTAFVADVSLRHFRLAVLALRWCTDAFAFPAAIAVAATAAPATAASWLVTARTIGIAPLRPFRGWRLLLAW